MPLSIHVLDVPAFVFVETPAGNIVVIPTSAGTQGVRVFTSVFLAARERAEVERTRHRTPPVTGFRPSAPSDSD